MARLVRPEGVCAQLANDGVAVFDGIEDSTGLIDLARSLGEVLPHPHNDEHGMTVIAERKDSAGGALGAGFTRAGLVPHTDRADMSVPPPVLVNLCTVQADAGGESTFVDGAAVHRHLAVQAPEALRALSGPRAVSYGRTHIYTGPVFEAADGGVRLRVWPREAGRFSREAEGAFDELQRAVAAHMVTVPLQAGQGYVIDNHRWLHGRRAYVGDRVMLRMGVAPHQGALLGTKTAHESQQEGSQV